MKVGEGRNCSKILTILNFKVSGNYNNYNLAPDTNGECYNEYFDILYEFLHSFFMKILAIFDFEFFCQNRGNFSN